MRIKTWYFINQFSAKIPASVTIADVPATVQTRRMNFPLRPAVIGIGVTDEAGQDTAAEQSTQSTLLSENCAFHEAGPVAVPVLT